MFRFIEIIFVLSAIFVGDFKLGPIPAYFIVYIGIYFYRLAARIEVTRAELLAYCVASFMVAPAVVTGLAEANPYYFSFVAFVLFIGVYPLAKRLIAPDVQVFICAYALLMLFFVFSVATIGSGKRTYLVFGPNVLYRIYGVIFFLMLFQYSMLRKTTSSTVMIYTGFLMTCLCLLATGSRGATVMLLLVTLAFGLVVRKQRGGTATITAFFMAAGVFLYINIDLLVDLFWRSFYFDATNASEASRIDKIKAAGRFLRDASPYDLLFGVGSSNRYYPNYPHNIVLETLVYHGTYFFAVLMAMGYLAVLVALRNRSYLLYLVLLSPVFLGSLVSGSFEDNVGVIGGLFTSLLLLKAGSSPQQSAEQPLPGEFGNSLQPLGSVERRT